MLNTISQLKPGKVKYEDVANAHAKDLAVEKKYGVDFIKYWVDEDKGLCIACHLPGIHNLS